MRKIDLKGMAHIMMSTASAWGHGVRRNPVRIVSGLVGLAILGAVAWLISSAMDVHQNNARLYAEVRAMDDGITGLSKEHERWLAEKKALEADPFYVEMLLGEKNMVKPGEKMVKSGN